MGTSSPRRIGPAACDAVARSSTAAVSAGMDSVAVRPRARSLTPAVRPSARRNSTTSVIAGPLRVRLYGSWVSCDCRRSSSNSARILRRCCWSDRGRADTGPQVRQLHLLRIRLHEGTVPASAGACRSGGQLLQPPVVDGHFAELRRPAPGGGPQHGQPTSERGPDVTTVRGRRVRPTRGAYRLGWTGVRRGRGGHVAAELVEREQHHLRLQRRDSETPLQLLRGNDPGHGAVRANESSARLHTASSGRSGMSGSLRRQGQMLATMIAATASCAAALTRLAGWNCGSTRWLPRRPGVTRSRTTKATACSSTPRMPNTTV